MTRLRILFTLFLLLFCTALATEYPLTLTDDLGREVRLEAEPLRIVAMLPSHTETLCALGVCDRLVGVDDYSNFPPQVDELPDLGGLHDPNLERMVALAPDLVLVGENSELAEALSALGLTVYAGSAQTFEETFEGFETLGRLVDREAEAAALSARVRERIEEIATLTAVGDAPKVYYELDASPYSVGPGSFIGVLIDKAGGENIVPETLGEFPLLDPEFVVSADPEIIILADAPYGESAETLLSRPGWSEIAALREERVVELSQEQVDSLSRPGPRLAEAVALLARIFHPELF